MTRPIIDEYALAKLMNKICAAKFTDEWLHGLKCKYQSTFVGCDSIIEESLGAINHSNNNINGSGEHLVVQCRLIDNNNSLNGSNQETTPQQQQLSGNLSALPTRDRLLYMKNLEETVSYIGTQTTSSCNRNGNTTNQQQPDVLQLLQDIRTYFADSSNSSSIPPLLQQQQQLNNSFMNDMFGVMSLDDEEAAEQRRRHFSSISDGSSSSDSSNNVTNYQQFENILQRIFKLTQMAGGGSGSEHCSPTSAGGVMMNMEGMGEKRQVESREELSSGYGRSSSASSSNDSVNPLSIGNAPTLGSLTVNIGSVLSDSGNGSPTPSFFRVKNSSSSASSLTQEPSASALNLKDFLMEDSVPELKRERLNTNPMDEIFRLSDHLPVGEVGGGGLSYFDRFGGSAAGGRDRSPFLASVGTVDRQLSQPPPLMSSWMASPLPQSQQQDNSSFFPGLPTGNGGVSRAMNRSFSVGAREQSSIITPNQMAPNRPEFEHFPHVTSSSANNFALCPRKRLYEMIAGQLFADGHQVLANQLVQAEGLLGGNFVPNSRLHSLVANGLKSETTNGSLTDTFTSESDIYLSSHPNEMDSFFNSSTSHSPYDVSSPMFGNSFARSNSVSVTTPNNGPSQASVLANKAFVSNRSQSQVVVSNGSMVSPQPIVPLTAPAQMDSSNFMLNETGLKNISQLAIKLNIEQQQAQQGQQQPSQQTHINQNAFVLELNQPPMSIPSRLNAINNTPSHTTGNGKFHREMGIKAKFGSLGPNINQFSSPHGFCLGFNEELVIADTSNHRICVYDKNGKFKSSFGTPGREEGQLYNPRKIATITLNRGGVETQCYVICDRGSERSRMQIFTRTGSFVRKILITFMEIVAGIVVNDQKQIVVVDSVHPTVFALNEKGKIEEFFDCSSFMCEPSDIAIFKNEYYICDFKGHCVVVFSPTGECLRKIGGPNFTSFPNGIDIAPSGDILVGDSHGNRFHLAIFNQAGNVIAEYECPHVKVSRCCGLKLTREGYIVTLAKNNHHVLVLNSLYQ